MHIHSKKSSLYRYKRICKANKDMSQGQVVSSSQDFVMSFIKWKYWSKYNILIFFYFFSFLRGPGCLGFAGRGRLSYANWRMKKIRVPLLLYFILCGLNKYQTYWRRQNRMYSIFHSLPPNNLQETASFATIN